MKRKILSHLQEWLKSDNRKPLILRGARQTGKTYIVRELANVEGYDLVEINFERYPELGQIFEKKNPKAILEEISIILGITIQYEHTILFLDEIQNNSKAIENLRWFYEELPQLAVVAAGSLLEFALAEHDFSMPVGRVTYMYMEPMSYIEFLWAIGQEQLAGYLINSIETFELNDAIANKALDYMKEYMLVGGMPECVNSWVASHDLLKCNQIQDDLISTYRDDFNKYRKRIQPEVLRATLESGARQIGCKFVYSQVNLSVKQPVIKQSLEMLCHARLFRKVYHSSSNGLPLGAEIKDNIFKIFMIDIGLTTRMLGLKIANQQQLKELVWSNKGALAEQLVCQLLATRELPKQSELYYWQQLGSGNGEIDFIIQKDGKVLPIEVKAGASGSMKSLHAFMEDKKLKKAYRFDLNKPSRQMINLKTNAGKEVSYELVSYPLYLAELL